MDEVLLRKFHKELSAGTVSLALLAVVAAACRADVRLPDRQAPGTDR